MIEDEILKNRQNNYLKNISSLFNQRAEKHKLQLRKSRVDDYIETKRMKHSETPTSIRDLSLNADPGYIDLTELNLNKELNLSDILSKLQILMMENLYWYQDTETLKECLVNLRKITCRQSTGEVSKMADKKIHVLLFKILEYYQSYDDYTDKEISLILEAVWTTNNMVCRAGSEIVIEIKRRNFLAVLRNYLYNTNDKVLEQTTMCLGNIIVESNYFRDEAIQFGILDRIVTISKDTKKPIDVLKNCVFLISNILRGKPHPTLEMIGPCLNIISACLWKKDEEVVKMCLWSLSYISDGYENIRSHIIQTGCIPKILEFVVMKKKELQIPSLRIIGNLAAGSNKLSEKLLDSNVLKTLIDLFCINNINQYLSYDDIMDELLWTFTNFSNSTVKVINYMIGSEKLNKAFNLMLHLGKEKVRYQILSIFYNYSKHGNKNSIDKLIDLGLIEIICKLFFDIENENANTSIMCIGLLNKIVKIQMNSDRNFETENKLHRILLENCVMERLDTTYLNTNDPIMNKLVLQGIEYIKDFFSMLNEMDYMN